MEKKERPNPNAHKFDRILHDCYEELGVPDADALDPRCAIAFHTGMIEAYAAVWHILDGPEADDIMHKVQCGLIVQINKAAGIGLFLDEYRERVDRGQMKRPLSL